MSNGEHGFPISRKLIDWYQLHKRDLPWRSSRDPYIIWISEVILQQTRVAQGLDYFHRFVDRFPSVSALAEASEDEVLKYWQGLGYYSRARNLHAAAQYIQSHYGGVFPQSYEEIRALKGIGDYTAAAIVSFAFNEPRAVVDGNVFRVLSRLFQIDTPIDTSLGKRIFSQLASEILSLQQPGLHNQAIMELGALQCVPQSPDCSVCPLQDHCLAYAGQVVSNYPVKQGKTKTRDRYFHYFHIINKEYTWVHRREQEDIWRGLYEFPLLETDSPCAWEELAQSDNYQRIFRGVGEVSILRVTPSRKHVLSHQTLHAVFYEVEVRQEGDLSSFFRKITQEQLGELAVPRLIHRYLETVFPASAN